jgi:hypothetical protein
MHPDDYACGSCGKAITGEPTDGSARQPCPACGATSRRMSVEGHITAHATVTADATFVTYSEFLLETADSLVNAGHAEMAVVTAHIACEIATERSFSRAFQHHHIDFLEEPLTAFFNGYNLANKRLRALYTALTGNQPEQQSFWPAFVASSERRNRVVHRGVPVTPPEAHESIGAARAFVQYVQK